MSPTPVVFLAAAALSTLAAPPALAEDAPAPSLEVPTDARAVYDAFAVSADPLAAFFGDYGIRVEGTLAAAHSLFIRPAYSTAGDHDSVGLEGGYHLWPLGDGLRGLYLGPACAISITTERQVAVSASLEAGWQWDLSGILVGVGAGATWSHAAQRSRIDPRVTLALGYAWM